MELFKTTQNGYKIYIFKNDCFLNIYVRGDKKEEKDGNKFKLIQINLKDNFNEYLLNFEEFIKNIKEKNIEVELEEILSANKTYIKYLYFKLLKQDSDEKKEIISKKIYVLNVKYYLTKGANHKRINSIPFTTYIKKDYFNIEDITFLTIYASISKIFFCIMI